MYYEESVIESVLAASDIVEVVSTAVHMEKRGSRYFGLCPFHNEKTPSFCVTPSRGMFYCFGCHEGGNVFSFLQKYENLTFSEAVEQLAERYNVALPSSSSDPEKEKKIKDEKNILFEINKEAATWYYFQLKSPKGKAGLDYFKARGLDDDTIRRFGLGYAPLSRDLLIKHLKSKGYEEADILKAGLAAVDGKSGIKDKFWNRVMFPIQDTSKRVIGFGGRVLGNGEPKYLNSPETLIFDKGRNLYALCHARSSRKGRFILCEGYMDVISLHKAGFNEAVASLGTAFTIAQALTLKRYTDEVILAYDSDEAGIKAALRGISILREAGLKAKVLDLSPFKDPDEFIKAKGADSFEERLINAVNSFYFEISVDEKSFSLSDPAEKTEFQKAIAARLSSTFSDHLERENYLSAVCARYHIDPQAMRTAVAVAEHSDIRINVNKERIGMMQSASRKSKENALGKQRMLLTWLLDDPDIYRIVKSYISPDDFTDPMLERLADSIFEKLEKGELNAARLIDTLESEEERKEAVISLNEDIPGINTSESPENEISGMDKGKILHDILDDIIKRSGDKKMSELDPSDGDYLKAATAIRKRMETFSKQTIVL